MTDTKPLHVQVAEALGWTDIQSLGPRNYGPRDHLHGTDLWVGLRPGVPGACFEPIPRYDTSWADTGPLIERYQMEISPLMGVRWFAKACYCDTVKAGLGCDHGWDGDSRGTLLEAVCAVILHLDQCGRLR